VKASQHVSFKAINGISDAKKYASMRMLIFPGFAKLFRVRLQAKISPSEQIKN
jgi:hypothetical protein